MELKRLAASVDDGEELLRRLRTAASDEANVDQRGALEQLSQLMAANVQVKMIKFIERLSWKDPVTAEPRYGPVMQEKIVALNERVEALKLGLAEIGQVIEAKGLAAEQIVVEERLAAQEEAQKLSQLELERQEKEAQAALQAENDRRRAEEAAIAAEHARLAAAAQKVREERVLKQQQEEARIERERIALQKLNNSVRFGLDGLVPALNKMEEYFNSTTPSKYPKALNVLHSLLQNICSAPENPLFRHIKQSNPFYEADVGQYPGGQDAMLAMGFKIVEQDGTYVFAMEEPDLAADLDAWSNWFDTLKAMRDHLALLVHPTS